MKKYLLVINNSFQQYFAYRLNFILWRVRVILFLLLSFFLWQTIFTHNKQIFGYDESQMLTYMLLISFIDGIVLSTQTFRIAEDINFGNLSSFLIRPVSYFGYVLAKDVTDKLINTAFSFFEIVLLIIILHPPFIIQTNPILLLMSISSAIIAAFVYFEINLLISFIGFWSKETWAPRFIFFILVTFLAGLYFPLDILPTPIFDFLRFLPFTYLVFFPLKLYLGQFTSGFIIQGFLINIFWLFILWLGVKTLWKKGLKVYTAEGG
jgi:ABC-2 type transport system permease protein